jgi:hypothetical protein
MHQSFVSTGPPGGRANPQAFDILNFFCQIPHLRAQFVRQNTRGEENFFEQFQKI